MMITPYLRGVVAAHTDSMRDEAARARRIAAAWAYKRSARRWKRLA
jgi:hypothetical protein